MLLEFVNAISHRHMLSNLLSHSVKALPLPLTQGSQLAAGCLPGPLQFQHKVAQQPPGWDERQPASLLCCQTRVSCLTGQWCSHPDPNPARRGTRVVHPPELRDALIQRKRGHTMVQGFVTAAALTLIVITHPVREQLSRCVPHSHCTFPYSCLLYTSDAADEEDSVDLGGRRIIKKKKMKDIERR
eukprot:TRINITY_DN6988_c0_g1_i3.p1 TRINITY_DN6988_c0_g1~~TRINITY_DN6988_c0_g1_i3.p1  ORF type:complete len:186 (+),score=27.34 TRINITY_DN6988_c0_g1_i3:755-1312(+)